MAAKLGEIFNELFEKHGIPLYFSMYKYLGYKDEFESKIELVKEAYDKNIAETLAYLSSSRSPAVVM